MTAYYNEFDPYAAQWLRNLIRAGLIAPGVVDERSIEDVRASELESFTQCHFFAGIGVWSHALRNAGWQDDRPVWTASCPCQPFSAAGTQDGFNDERHLWPALGDIIQQLKPTVIFGEQVAAPAAEPWIDLVQADLEALGYAVGCVAFPAASVGAPNVRDRAYWLADSNFKGLEGRGVSRIQCENKRSPWSNGVAVRGRDGEVRCIEPGTFPLVNGAAARVGRIRAYGNALNAEAATQFIAAYMEL